MRKAKINEIKIINMRALFVSCGFLKLMMDAGNGAVVVGWAVLCLGGFQLCYFFKLI